MTRILFFHKDDCVWTLEDATLRPVVGDEVWIDVGNGEIKKLTVKACHWAMHKFRYKGGDPITSCVLEIHLETEQERSIRYAHFESDSPPSGAIPQQALDESIGRIEELLGLLPKPSSAVEGMIMPNEGKMPRGEPRRPK